MEEVFPNSALGIKLGSTWYFSCKSATEQSEFEKFLRADISITTVGSMVFVSSLFVGFYIAALYYLDPTPFNLFGLICGTCFEVILGIVVWGFLFASRKSHDDGMAVEYYNKVLTYLENLFVIGYTFAGILIFSAFTIDGLCLPTNENNHTRHCNITTRAVPEAFMALMFFFPVLLSVSIKSAKSELIFLSWFANFAFLFVVIALFSYTVSWGSFVAFALVTLILLYEYQRQKISMYFLAKELSVAKTENERLAEENRASELKHLIGNVAHDLKTPLSSLNMGIDLMSGELLDFVEKTASVPEFIRDRIRSHVACVEENLRNMKNVNAFMLMTINRCMDYTKATTGLKLVPKLGTVALLETIALPLHVMNAMHDGKTKIELMPVAADICNHIITDMQWLQENVMCLLSNAVKYSSKGLITMRVSIVPRVTSKRGKPLESNVNSQPVDKYRKPLKQQYKRVSSLHPIDTSECILSDIISNRPVSLSLLQPELVLSSPTNDGFSPNSNNELKQRQSQFLRFEVEDNGIGLSDEVMQSLFSPFKQAQRLAGGTGLGLFSLSRRLDAIGGFYGVERRCDGLQGSVFWFEIPYKPDTEYAENMVGVSEEINSTFDHYSIPRDIVLSTSSDSPAVLFTPHTSSRPQFLGKHNDVSLAVNKSQLLTTHNNKQETAEGKLNILLADDTLSIQKMTCMLLRRQGHMVTVAENGAEALEMVTAKYTEYEEYRRNGGSSPFCLFDVVLMDFQMPIMDGLEATSRIRKVEAELLANCCGDVSSVFHQKIIGLSANSDEETVQLARDAGIDDFMEKPFKAAVFDEIWSRIGKKESNLCDDKNTVNIATSVNI